MIRVVLPAATILAATDNNDNFYVSIQMQEQKPRGDTTPKYLTPDYTNYARRVGVQSLFFRDGLNRCGSNLWTMTLVNGRGLDIDFIAFSV